MIGLLGACKGAPGISLSKKKREGRDRKDVKKRKGARGPPRGKKSDPHNCGRERIPCNLVHRGGGGGGHANKRKKETGGEIKILRS